MPHVTKTNKKPRQPLAISGDGYLRFEFVIVWYSTSKALTWKNDDTLRLLDRYQPTAGPIITNCSKRVVTEITECDRL